MYIFLLFVLWRVDDGLSIISESKQRRRLNVGDKKKRERKNERNMKEERGKLETG
jgi:hypothetical protein